MVVPSFLLRPSVLQIVGNFLASLKAFPPRRRPGSFTIDKAIEALSKPASGAE